MVSASQGIGRRSFLTACGGIVLGLTWSVGRSGPARAQAASPDGPKKVTIVEFSDAGARKGTVTVYRITKTEAEWRKQLSPESFEVTRHEGTERPYTNEHPNGGAKGIFRCICCATALFDSSTKFESGTGWPSFWAPIAKENVVETSDRSFGMVRTAVACRRCDAHLGHVFDDGPKPTGLRYCMNSVSMKFVRAA